MPVFQNVPNQRKKWRKKSQSRLPAGGNSFVEVETLPNDAPVMRSQQLILGPLRLVFHRVFQRFRHAFATSISQE